MGEMRSNDSDKMDEVMLPGFRFHPTDEELVGFYLKRKIQQRPLSIELIKQLDIYKFDPWDLPKLATMGEREWYFYCPRDRKYRNSARPNRVTGAGFWKATGTDRPIYSSEGCKCIGLKKSLVFYKGKAAKGIKTDWMMHEFRLPSITDSIPPPKRFLDKNVIPANDSWAVCRIFKKTNSTAPRALSHSWVSPMPQTSCSNQEATTASDLFLLAQQHYCQPKTHHFTAPASSCLENNNNLIMSSLPTKTTTTSTSSSSIQYYCYGNNNNNNDNNNNELQQQQQSSIACSFSAPLIIPSKSSSSSQGISIDDASSLLLNMSSSLLGDFSNKACDNDDQSISLFYGMQEQCNNGMPSSSMPVQEIQDHFDIIPNYHQNLDEEDQWGAAARSSSSSSIGVLPFSLPWSNINTMPQTWKLNNSFWDYSSSPCPTEMSTTYSTTNNCYT